MNALGFYPGDDIIRKSIQDIDNDSKLSWILLELVSLKGLFLILDSGTVDFEEFICMMSKFRQVKTTTELDDELKEIFQVSYYSFKIESIRNPYLISYISVEFFIF